MSNLYSSLHILIVMNLGWLVSNGYANGLRFGGRGYSEV